MKFLTGFGQRPQHVLGTIGLALFFVGAFGLAYLAGAWCIFRLHVIPGMARSTCKSGPALIYSIALLLLGGQFMSIGFLAELFVAYHDPESRSYSISERTPPRIKNDQ